MADSNVIVAHTIGNPSGGLYDNPWPSGEPSAGVRVAIFAHEVTAVDREAEHIRSYHVAPADRAGEGPVTPDRTEAQGVTVRWTGCGTGTVVGALTDEFTDPRCQVTPDDMRLIDA